MEFRRLWKQVTRKERSFCVEKKTEEAKRRKIMLKNIRDKDNEKRKKWSKDHGSDTYGKAEVKHKKEKKEHCL